MWKKLRLPLLVIAAVSLAALLFSWQLKFLYVPVRAGMEKLTGQPVTFSKIEYRLFNRITIRDLTVGSTFKVNTITVYFNPLQLLTTLAAPQYALFRIHFSAPSISVTPELSRIIEHLRKDAPARGTASPVNDLKISWEDAVVASGERRIDRLSGQAIVGRDITGRMTGKFKAEQISLLFDVQSEKEGSSSVRAEVKMSGPSSDIDILLNGIRTPAGVVTASVNAPKLTWADYSVAGTSGTIYYSEKRISATVTSNVATVAVNGSDSAPVSVLADITLAPLVPNTSGSIHIAASSSKGTISGTATATGLAYKGQSLGDISFSYLNNAADNWDISG